MCHLWATCRGASPSFLGYRGACGVVSLAVVTTNASAGVNINPAGRGRFAAGFGQLDNLPQPPDFHRTVGAWGEHGHSENDAEAIAFGLRPGF